MKIVSAVLFVAFLFAAGIGTYLITKDKPTPKLASSTVYVEMETGHGSGVHIGNGMVLTAWHVVNGKEKIVVIDSKDTKHDTEVMWSNETYDVALLRIKEFKSVAWRRISCRFLDQGESLSFEGSPHSLGLVKSWGRVARAPIKETYDWKEAYLIDGTLGPGMSGGPAIDSSGFVVGINVGMLNNSNFVTIVPSRTVCALLAK